MTAPKLNTVISTNVPMRLRMKKRGGTYPETDYTTKQPTGRNVFLYIFEDEKGMEVSHYATEPQEDTLRLFQPGDWLQVVRKEELNTKTNKRFTMYVFTPEDGAEARLAATPQLRNNTTETRIARQQDERHVAEEDKWHGIAVSKIVHEYMKKAMEKGVMDAKGAAQIAYDFYREQAKLHERILSEDSQA